MKNYFFAAIAASALLFSCKKNDKEATCDKTVAAIAGNYKVTKVTVNGQDQTGAFISENCVKDDIYQFKADKSLVYVDAGTACSPAGDGVGNWDVVNGTISFDHDGYGITLDGSVANKCNRFEVTASELGVTYVVTFTKQ